MARSVEGVSRFLSYAAFFSTLGAAIPCLAQTTPPAQTLQEAEALSLQKKWADAAVVFRATLRQNPEHTGAALGLARALAFSGRREEALTLLLRFADQTTGDRRTVFIRRAKVLGRVFLTNNTFQLYQDGLNFMQTAKIRAARERFEKALEQEPDNVEILTRLGQTLMAEKDFDSASERLRLATRLGPFEPEIRLWLGHALHQRGELKEALEELRAAHQALPDLEMGVLWLAATLISSGQRAAAIQFLTDSCQRHPGHLLALFQLARLRLQSPDSKSSQALWASRKDLQLILSRLKTNSAFPPPASGRAFPFDLAHSSEEPSTEADASQSTDVKKELEKSTSRLLQEIDHALAPRDQG